MDEATKVIDHIAYSNNKEEAVSPQLHPNIDALVQFVNYTGKPRQVQQVDTEYSVIFKNKKLLRTQILFSLIIAYLYLAYNGILFGLNYLQGSLYTNSLVTSIAETSAYAVSSNFS